MNDAPKRKCPKCAKNTLERKIGVGAAVLFKGSGFYQTDYRSASYKKAAEAEKPAESKPAETKGEPKSDGKAATRIDPKPTSTKAETKSRKGAKPDSD